MSAFEAGRKIAGIVAAEVQDTARMTRDKIRERSVPQTDEHTAFVEVTVTFPGGEQSRYGSPIGTDGEAFAWSASKDGVRIRVQGTSELLP